MYLCVCVGVRTEKQAANIQHDPHCQYLALLCNGIMEVKGGVERERLAPGVR